VRILLDTFNDRRKAYILIFNPLGVQADGILTEGRGEDYSVDILMESKGVVSDEGYTVEVAIPFKSLRYEAGENKLWGVHLFRRIKRFNNELDSWTPISRDKSSLLGQEGHIIGLEGIATEHTLELIPSLTLIEEGKRVRTLPAGASVGQVVLPDQGRIVNQAVKPDLGLTMKLGVTPTMTLDFALNPDFAQVEADRPVITANQRFPIFFDEKRPFFLEGIDIFQTLMTAVHTRAIIDPDIAVKLTGRRGRDTYGLLLASDNAPGNFTADERLDPRNFRFIDKNASIGILRWKRNIGRGESSLGFLATSYDFVEKHNHLGGIDGRIRLNPITVFDFQVLFSNSKFPFFEPEQGRRIYHVGNALAYAYAYEHAGRNFNYKFIGLGRTREFRSDVGFLTRTNTNNQGLFLRYGSDPKAKARLVSWRLSNFFYTNFNWQGRSQLWTNETTLSGNFQRQTSLSLIYDRGYERVFEEEFGPKRTATQTGAFFGSDPERSAYNKAITLVGETTPNKKFAAYASVSHTWGALDFDSGAGPRFPRVSPAALLDPNALRDPGPGNKLDINLSLLYKPTSALRTSLDYTKSRLNRILDSETPRVGVDVNIFIWRTSYQFTRFTFARARLDYTTLAARVRAQLLLGWTPSPGTSLYVGYNDDVNYNGFSPFNNLSESGFHRNQRAFFIKMSYLFQRSF
jgi:hypothetical protein